MTNGGGGAERSSQLAVETFHAEGASEECHPIARGRAMAEARPAAVPRRTENAPRSARLGGGTLTVLGATAVLAVVFATNQVLPATSDHQAQLRIWLGSRAAGITALVLLTFEVVVGLVLSHPTNKSTWRLSKRLFPWHEHVWVFTLAFVAVHVVSIAADRFAKVGWLGAIVPGMSEYRTVPVAIGTLALYALVITGLTARVTKLLPAGWWLKLHRLSVVVLALAWVHGMLAGSDTAAAAAVYASSFAAVLVAAAYRYWIVRAGRPTFATSLAREDRR
jgi:DMSO/TMAO reductase YedYZ heme-binding membrane subunit